VAGNVNVGSPVTQIAAGGGHTCAILTASAAVRCWGWGSMGRLGYGNTQSIGDSESPASAGNVTVVNPTFPLYVTTTGQGTVNAPAIVCGGFQPDCSESFPAGNSVTLTATPASGWVFGSWGGSCSGTNPTTSVTMNQAHVCTATFTQVSGGTMPTFGAAGSGVFSTAALSVPYPPSVTSGQLLLLQIGTRSASAVTTPSGWTLLHFDQHPISNPRQHIFWKVAAGTETGSLPVPVAATTSVNAGRMYSFSGVRTAPFTEASVAFNGTGGDLTSPSLTTLGPNRIAVCFVALDNIPAMNPFVGETGGDWVEAVPEFAADAVQNFSLQLQIAPLPTTGTITSGTATFGGGTDDSVARAFALIGQ
jgi:hypothetical protein